MKEFYSLSSKEVLKNLNTSASGLSQEKAQDLLQKNGKNKLAEGKKKTRLQKFLAQFKDVMIIILLIAAAVSIVMSFIENDNSSLIEGGIILIIVLPQALQFRTFWTKIILNRNIWQSNTRFYERFSRKFVRQKSFF